MILSSYTAPDGKPRPGLEFDEVDLKTLRSLQGEDRLRFLSQLGTQFGSDIRDGAEFYGGKDEILLALTDSRTIPSAALGYGDERRVLTEATLEAYHSTPAEQAVTIGGQI